MHYRRQGGFESNYRAEEQGFCLHFILCAANGLVLMHLLIGWPV